jgi:two-component system chemotaxis sensor kinase CheA
MAAVPAQTAPAAPAAAPPKIQEERGKNGPEPAPPPATRQPDAGKKVALKETVKVDADRLDKLLDTIGELVIAESMVTQSGELRAGISAGLAKNLSLLDKITRELQSMGTSLRMVPVASTFQKMARLARDLSKKIDKEIEFVTRGDETELDKTVVDKIGDPLVHMVRNAIDHGIEKSREERARAGKPPKGRVELRAFHKGGCIFIEIEDDGRGLDKNAIRRKALEKGLIGQADNLTDKEIYALIFAPGFSTAEKITEISGRGVGMDVARKNIDSMRGQIDIQSELGRGSVFSIKLPLTLAIIDGMVVNVRGELYIIPTLSIVMSVKISKNELKTVQKRGVMLPIQGELIPVFSLDQILSRAPEAAPDTALETRDDLLIVVVEDDNKKTGVIVDRLEGQHQIVIKPLGDYLHGVSGLAGGAIMPDGTVGLIIDVGGIVRLAGSRAAPAES